MLFAVLGGLFLMHGLSSHGAMHHAGSADAAMVRAAGTSGAAMVRASGAAMVHSGAAVADRVSAARPSVEPPARGDGHGAQVAELCMAVLAGGLLLALLGRRGGITAGVRARRTRRDAGVLALAFTRRPPDPPDLRRLSVCRC